MILKFSDQIIAGNHIVSYNAETREYMLGIDQGEYLFQPDTVGDYANLRKFE